MKILFEVEVTDKALFNAASVIRAMADGLSAASADASIPTPTSGPPKPPGVNGGVGGEAPNLPGAGPTEGAVAVPSTVDLSLGLDANNLPWDSRINTKTKNKTAKNTFKLQKGLDKQFVEDVKKELAALSLKPDAGPPTPPASQDPPDPPPHPGRETGELDFGSFVNLTLQRMANAELTKEEVNTALQSFGFTELGNLVSASPDVLYQVSQICEGFWAKRKFNV
jgi:hypothetical protein